MKIMQLSRFLALLSVFLIGLAMASTEFSKPADIPTPPTVSRPAAPSLANFPLLFIPNQGQWDDSIHYRTRTAGVDVAFTANDVMMSLQGQNDQPQIVRLRPLDAPAEIALSAGEVQVTKMHYFVGQDASRWQTAVPTYDSVRYQDIQPGVDWLFRSNGTELAYDLELAPRADPTQIRLALEGVTALAVDAEGALLMTLPNGQTVRQHAPFIYQLVNGEQVEIEGRFLILESNPETAQQVFGFEVGDYDPSLALVIDPTLEYSTLFGGAGDDTVSTIAVTPAGETVVVGSTTLPLGNTRRLPHDASPAGRSGLVYQLSVDGRRVDYAVVLGGSANDQINGVVLDGSDVYLIGQTRSANFPIVDGLYPVLPGGHAQAAFITKLDTSGASPELAFSTYFGGSAPDAGQAIGVDGDFVYAVGETESFDILMHNALYPTNPGGKSLFLLALHKDGQRLHTATYFGSSLHDTVTALQVAQTGDLYIAGYTTGADFPLQNPWQARHAGVTDGFVTHIAPVLQDVVFSTYLGGEGFDVISDLAIADATQAPIWHPLNHRHLLISGYTNSADFPVHNALYPHHAGNFDAFVVKLDKFGRFPHFSTYLGAHHHDQAHAIAIDQVADATGQRWIHVGGDTQSNNFPVVNALQSYYAGNRDGFIARLDEHGRRIRNASFFGGPGIDTIVALATAPNPAAADAEGHIFVAGNTASNINFPTTERAFQETHGGSGDQFVARVNQSATSRLPALELRPTHADQEGNRVVRGEINPEVEQDENGTVMIDVDLIMHNVPETTATDIASFSTWLHFDPAELEYVGIVWEPEGFDHGPSGYHVDVVSHAPGTLGLFFAQEHPLDELASIHDGAIVARLTFKMASPIGTPGLPAGETKTLVITQENTDAINTSNRSLLMQGLTGSITFRRPCNDNLVGDCNCSGSVQLAEVQALASAILRHAPVHLGAMPYYPICMKDIAGSTALNTAQHPKSWDLVAAIEAYLGMTQGGLQQPPPMQESDAALILSSKRFFDDRIEVDLVLNAAQSPIAAITGDVYYDPQMFSELQANTGVAALAAGKGLSFNLVEPGHLRVLIWGPNLNTIDSGIVGTLRLTLTEPIEHTHVPLKLRAFASSPDRQAIAL